MKSSYTTYGVSGMLAILLFVFISESAQTYAPELQGLTETAGIFGIVAYIGITTLSIVIAPIGTGFLLPIAANSWGPVLATVYSVIGWTTGSMIAFLLARHYGLRLVKKHAMVTKLRTIEQAIPRHHMFLTVTLLRMALPVDLLSYALGIFSSMGYQAFFWSTIIGITPFALVFSYASTGSLAYQLFVSILGVSVFLGGVYYVFRYRKTHVDTAQ